MNDWNVNIEKYVGHIHSSGYDSQYLREQGVIKNIVKILGNVEKETLLDLGCGDGWLSHRVTCKSFIECDIQEPSNLISRPNFVIGDAYKIPFNNTHFNIVIGSLLLMWLKDLDKAAKEIFRVTTSDGYFLACITSPHFYRTTEVDESGTVKFIRSLAHNFVLTDLYIGGKVGPFTYYYRPLSEYVNVFVQNGWIIEYLSDWFIDMQDYKRSLPGNANLVINRTDKTPLYTFIKFRKQ